MLFVFSAFVLLVGWMAYILLTEWLKRRKARKRAFGAPFPLEWEAILERNLTAYACMPAELRPRLHQRILLFLAGKSFEGCGGLIGRQLGGPGDIDAGLRNIIVGEGRDDRRAFLMPGLRLRPSLA